MMQDPTPAEPGQKKEKVAEVTDSLREKIIAALFAPNFWPSNVPIPQQREKGWRFEVKGLWDDKYLSIIARIPDELVETFDHRELSQASNSKPKDHFEISVYLANKEVILGTEEILLEPNEFLSLTSELTSNELKLALHQEDQF